MYGYFLVGVSNQMNKIVSNKVCARRVCARVLVIVTGFLLLLEGSLCNMCKHNSYNKLLVLPTFFGSIGGHPWPN